MLQESAEEHMDFKVGDKKLEIPKCNPSKQNYKDWDLKEFKGKMNNRKGDKSTEYK